MNLEAVIAQKDAQLESFKEVVAQQGEELESSNAIIKKLSERVLELEDRLLQINRMLYGKKSERFEYANNQLNLFTGQVEVEEQQPTEKEITVPEHRRKVKNKNHQGRSLLSNCDHLKVEEEHIETPHGEDDIKIGDLIREKLGYKPGELYIKRTITPKYKSADTGKISVGEQPSEPIPKCEADVSLLAYIVVSKFVDHLPEYRIQKIFKRDGVKIAPSTMNGWTHKIAELFKPMAKHIEKKILATGYIQMDESTIKVLKSKKGKSHLGYMWVIYSPAIRCVSFIYHKGRSKEAPIEILKDYKGKLQSDGYNVYEVIESLKEEIELSNCNVHARRKFEKALSNDKDTAGKVMRIYQKMYKIERQINEKRDSYASKDEFYAYRKEQRKAMEEHVGSLKELIFNPPVSVPPKSSTGQAILYTRKRWDKLMKFIEDGEIEMDTNFVENCIRPLALGRKNYLFAGNNGAATNIGVFYTVFNTCRHLDINVSDYTTWYLNNVSTIKINAIHTLSPMAYKDTIKNNENLDT